MSTTYEQALKAKNSLRQTLARPGWLRGIGVSIDEKGDHVVEVRVEADTPEMHEVLPSEVDGVTVRVKVTGAVRAQ